MNQLCTIGASYSAFENSSNRESTEPITEYIIRYIIGHTVRQVKITAASPFKALRIFKELFIDTYNNSSIKEVQITTPEMEIKHEPKPTKVVKLHKEKQAAPVSRFFSHDKSMVTI